MGRRIGASPGGCSLEVRTEHALERLEHERVQGEVVEHAGLGVERVEPTGGEPLEVVAATGHRFEEPPQLVANLTGSVDGEQMLDDREAVGVEGGDDIVDPLHAAERRAAFAGDARFAPVPDAGVVVVGLKKRFGSFQALAGVDFQVASGTIAGLLGPNGAGKTTTINILTTLLRADGGHARVVGYDVATQPQLVRSVIGLTGQYSAVDEDLTGRENLVLVGRLGRLPKRAAKDRAAELLEVFDLVEAGDRLLKTYSGGMRRRLDLGASLMVAPAVLFLDEPTTGLDPRSRMALWDIISELRGGGTTIVLTTQYMEEADHLADRISVIDGGKIIAEGTADELKAMIGGDVVHLLVRERGDVRRVATLLDEQIAIAHGELLVDDELGTIQVPVPEGAASALVEAVLALDREGIALDDLGLRRPSLDDVFLGLTGHMADELRPDAAQPRRARLRA